MATCQDCKYEFQQTYPCQGCGNEVCSMCVIEPEFGPINYELCRTCHTKAIAALERKAAAWDEVVRIYYSRFGPSYPANWEWFGKEIEGQIAARNWREKEAADGKADGE